MDTVYYLSKGSRVIAVEANPVLCEEARHRFALALRSGKRKSGVAMTLAPEF